MTQMRPSNEGSLAGKIFTTILLLGCLSTSTTAAPYASGLTNNAGQISFRLNEAADNVKVISSGGTVTNDLGALPAGVTSVNLAITGAFQVQATRGGTGLARTNTPIVAFNSPRGVAVNRNPASSAFGRVYVANSADGVKGDGIFVFNSDLSDALGQGATALTGGLDFASGTTASPYRLTVGEDDGQVYIADWSDPTGNLYVADPDIATATFALKPLSATGAAVIPVTQDNNHGSVAAVAVAGSTSAGNMTIYIVDEDLATDRDFTGAVEMNSLWQIPVGAGPLPSSVFDPANKLMTPAVSGVSQTMDLARGPNGYLYVMQYRSVGNEPAIYVVDPVAGLLTNSLQISRAMGESTDILKASGGVAVSPDGLFLAVLNLENNAITVMTLKDGIPDLSNRTQFTGLGTTANGRGIAFDAANNLYAISSGMALLQGVALDIPSTATTGSDGTFQLDERFISITAMEGTAGETGPTSGIITITRHGATNEALTVNLTLSGSASNTTDYAALPTSVTFAPGQSSTNLVITPVDDAQSEINETVVVSLAPSANYTFFSSSATVTIVDNDAPLVNITTTVPTAYERVFTDFVTFQVSRGGDIANSALSVNIAYSGTASDGVDYTSGTTSVYMDNGQGSATVTLYPLDDALVEGAETIIATIVPDPTYIVGSSNATATILDDEFAPENPIFSDAFETDSSANWTITAGAANGTADYLAAFGYDFASKGIPAAPGDSTTLGLIATANKLDGTASAAGVNLYPSTQTFSGDYALRFKMYIEGVNGAGTTEHVLFGINHSGTKTNFALRSTSGNGFSAATPAGGDGIWFNIVADSSGFSGGNDFGAFVSVSAPPTILASATATSLTNVFKTGSYRFAGTPASSTLGGIQNWVDVEVRQVNNVVTLSVNKTDILSFTNTTAFTSGKFMLGYNDAFGSVGGGVGNSGPSFDFISSGFVVYDDVRVISMAPLRVNKTQVSNGQLVIEFTDSAAGTYTLQEATSVTGPYSNTAATVTVVSPGLYRFSVPFSAANAQRFYRIKK